MQSSGSEEWSSEQKSSIKLTKNAKGHYQWEIRVFSEDPESIPDRLKKIDDELNKSFPREE